MFFLNAEQCQRQSDFVVKVALCFQNTVLFGKHTRNKFLGTGLSHTAGNAYHRDGQTAAIKRSHLAQRTQRVIHQYVRSPGICRNPVSCFHLFRCHAGNHTCRSFFKHLTDETVSVHLFSLSGKEKTALFYFPGIDDRAGNFPCFVSSCIFQFTAAGSGNILQGQIFHNSFLSFPISLRKSQSASHKAVHS